jgi:hypothetical protein
MKMRLEWMRKGVQDLEFRKVTQYRRHFAKMIKADMVVGVLGVEGVLSFESQ